VLLLFTLAAVLLLWPSPPPPPSPPTPAPSPHRVMQVHFQLLARPVDDTPVVLIASQPQEAALDAGAWGCTLTLTLSPTQPQPEPQP